MVILGIHSLQGKHVISQHTLLHLMGLSGFFELFQVENKSTVGSGLWFITAIVLMYLLFPALQKLFQHPHRLLHLALCIVLCYAFNYVMYGTASTWNVIVSFSVGVYCGVNNFTHRLIHAKSLPAIAGSTLLLMTVALATAHILPFTLRTLLFPLYPFTFVPFLFAISNRLPKPLVVASSFFAGVSYEFYILHLYFINAGFLEFFPKPMSIARQIIISFVISVGLAYAISRFAIRLRRIADEYLLAT